MWKQARGSEATYINLIGVFQRAGHQDYADRVRTLFELEPDTSTQRSQ